MSQRTYMLTSTLFKLNTQTQITFQCYTVNFIIDWDIAWQNNLLNICQSELCKHERCPCCDERDISGFWETRIESLKQDLIDDSVTPKEIDDLEASQTRKSDIQHGFSTDLDNLEPSRAMGTADFDQFLGYLEIFYASHTMEVEVALDGILREPNNLAQAESIQVLRITSSPVMDKIPRETTRETASEATAAPSSNMLHETPTYHPHAKSFSCPFSVLLSCARTFTHPAYARKHAKIHTHHHPCPSPRCRSRFTGRSSLAEHMSSIHCLDNIADLPASCKGRLGRVEGRYLCRFRELLGCERTFSQNGHANRHAAVHAREEAAECGVRGCGMRFLERGNWAVHFWEVHFEVVDLGEGVDEQVKVR